MSIKRYEKIPSSDKIHQLNFLVWEPDDLSKAKGIVQLSHGMTEFIERYDDFAQYLNQMGFIVAGHDHLGHGKSVNSQEEWGYFAKNHSSKTVVNDLYKITRKLKAQYQGLKLCLLGHSMGSFLLRRYLVDYSHEVDAAVIMGTGYQPVPMLYFGRFLVKTLKLFKGDKAKSPFIEGVLFQSYNKKFSKDKNGMHWLTKDEQIRQEYLAHPACNFMFSLNGYYTLLDTMLYAHKKGNMNKIRKDLPMFIVSGEDDPVGNYSKGVKTVFSNYKKLGITNIQMKLYKKNRHEILNELNRSQVYKDLGDWILGQVSV